MDEEKRKEVWNDFETLVNMTPKEIETWLDTDDSKRVGAKDESGGESVGHKSGKTIIEVLKTRKSDLSDDQWSHMQKVVGYIKRHSKQKPKGDIEDTNWRFSLMNWGHDPEKD